jgi:hypothetical protein
MVLFFMSKENIGNENDAGGRDHFKRFQAYEQNEAEINERIRSLMAAAERQSIDFQDPDSHILLKKDEISRLWGIFPEQVRNRAIPKVPKIITDGPIWFSPDSSSSQSHVTENVSEAISPTAHGMAATRNNMNDYGRVLSSYIEAREIPENGFSKSVRKLIQAGVFVHEMAHLVTTQDMWGERLADSTLTLTNGKTINTWEWMWHFAALAEAYPPISRYSSAYRNEEGHFPRNHTCQIIIGTGVSEELAEHITAHLLGFIVEPSGELTFEPFAGREDMQGFIQAYLEAEAK